MGKAPVKFDATNMHLGGNVPGGDPFSLCPNLWQWAIKKFNVLSVFDIGCGDGFELEYFKKQNLNIFGIDGLKENIVEVKKRGIDCDVFDLTKGVYKDKKFDMIWCCELVEHIEEKFVENILNTFLCGKIILMTHALPRQRGHHHVNCKDDGYWIRIMTDKKFEYLKEESLYSRLLDKGTHWQKSGLIFKNKRGDNE
jgi:SAM-dependent methyltransferase